MTNKLKVNFSTLRKRNIHIFLAVTLVFLLSPGKVMAEELPLETYLTTYDYAERWDMKITSQELVRLLKQDKVQFLDIRFVEEYATWRMGFGMHIPLPELPNQLDKLDRNKLVVTACPQRDRAIIAMVYLKTQGFKAKYLVDGMVDLADYLRGDMALELTDP
jgi:rhodanese-related sulfurtransferase